MNEWDRLIVHLFVFKSYLWYGCFLAGHCIAGPAQNIMRRIHFHIAAAQCRRAPPRAAPQGERQHHRTVAPHCVIPSEGLTRHQQPPDPLCIPSRCLRALPPHAVPQQGHTMVSPQQPTQPHTVQPPRRGRPHRDTAHTTSATQWCAKEGYSPVHHHTPGH